MKTIKMLQTGLMIAVLTILIGCSDQFMNPDLSSKNNLSDGSGKSNTENSATNSLTTILDLKPNSSFTFDNTNTDFKKINSINAEIITVRLPAYQDCNNLIFYSKKSNSDIEINCISKGLNLEDLTIENTGDDVIKVSLILTGELKIPKPLKQ